MPRFREEVLNVTLAEVLSTLGLEADPETVESGKLPDVLINMGGLKLVLEGRRRGARSLLGDTRRRVEDGLADIALAVFYQGSLFDAPSLAALRRSMEQSSFSGCLFYLRPSGIAQEPFDDLSVSDLVETINRAFRMYVRNDILRDRIADVQSAIEGAATVATETGLFFQSDALLSRLRQVLGLDEEA